MSETQIQVVPSKCLPYLEALQTHYSRELKGDILIETVRDAIWLKFGRYPSSQGDAEIAAAMLSLDDVLNYE